MYQGASVQRARNPRERAGLLRVFFFAFTADIFRKSRKRDLRETDVYEPLVDCETSRIGNRLQFAWQHELDTGRHSMTRALANVFGKTYLMYGLATLMIKSCLMTINPLIIGRLISYFAPYSTMTRNDACMYGGLLVLCGFLQCAFNHHYHLLMSVLGVKIKAALASLIYRKALRMSGAAVMDVTSGKLVTLISKDAASFDGAMNFFHDVWIGIVQLVIMSFVMYKQIQEATFVGVALLLALVPVQIFIARFSKILRLRTGSKTDERLKRMQEILTSIKLLKLYNWIDYYTQLTNKLRIEEMKKLRLIFYLRAAVLTLSQLSQRLSFYVCIMYYVLRGNLITAEKVFIVIGCYNNMRFVLTVAMPMCVTLFAEARSSMKRIKQALLAADVPEVPQKPEIITRVRVEAAAASVQLGDVCVLQQITFRAQSATLIAITGNVASGKSTFLKALLQDVELSSGHVSAYGTRSYASQEPWLYPATIKQNILFGQEFDRDRYQEVLRACALVKDLEGFPAKDNTIVNDKGLNLSKGQQARINLARAVYKPADIYLLDDVMVSLDATVSKHVFDQCFQKLLADKLVIFVCHNKKYLKMTDRIVVLNKGLIQAEGHYDDLILQGIEFSSDNVDALEGKNIETTNNVQHGDGAGASEEDAALLMKSTADVNPALYGEHQQQGKVQWEVYKHYLNAAGGWKIFVLIVILFSVSQMFGSYFDYYVQKWLKVEERLSGLNFNITNNLTNITFESETYLQAEIDHKNTIFTYTFLITMAIILVTIQLFAFFTMTARASKMLHNTVFAKITGATMTFFDANLSGNILNRFSKDIGTIDENLPYRYFETSRVLFFIIGITAVITALNPILLLPTVFMLAVMFMGRRYYLVASRGLKRLDGSTRAPVIGYLNSSLEGLTTIRASGNQELLTRQFERHQDLNTSALIMYYSIERTFGFWLDFLCKIYIGFVVFYFLFLYGRGEGLAGKVGVIIMQAFGLMGLLQWGIRQSADLENQMTSVERVAEYGSAEQERLSGVDPDNWPLKGHIEYRNVSLRYRDEAPFVLNNVSLEIKSCERVGIVGRTGAGKSSIIAALFRLYRIQGSIIIDDVDIKDIELPIVRSKISIIPQEPVLFAGTVRSNLDPEEQFTDTQLWNVLGEVELKYDMECLKEGLSSEVLEGGRNFSVGQRQLMCLARAVLRDNKILVLDEATANIDPNTDELIQKTIKRLFTHCTILTIAHRLHTVIDSDRIMVVDGGKVVEFDTPQRLIDRGEDGVFYHMAKEAGLVNQ